MQGIEEKLIKIRVYTTKKGNMHYKNYNLLSIINQNYWNGERSKGNESNMMTKTKISQN